MKRRLHALKLLSAFLLALPLWSAAERLPWRIGFQGKLLDGNNIPRNGPYDLTFKLYASPSGGSPLYTEIQSNVPVVNGVFSTHIGSLTALSPELFSGASVYLGITVETDSEMTPLQQLVMSPYAVTAAQLVQSEDIRVNAGTTYSTFTAGGTLTLAAGVAAATGAFTATGASQFSLVTSSGIQVQGGALELLGAGGGLRAGGISAGTATLTGTGGYSLRASSGILVQAGELRVDGINGIVATTATLTATGNSQYSLTTSSGIQVAAGTLRVNGNLSVSGRAAEVGTNLGLSVTYGVSAGSFTGVGASSSVYKSADESRSSTVVLADDAALRLDIGANDIWTYSGMLFATSASATPDIRIAWTVPAGANVTFSIMASSTSMTAFGSNVLTASGAMTSVQLAANLRHTIQFQGIVETTGTSGDVRLQWCQNTSNGTATVLKALSFMTGQRLR